MCVGTPLPSFFYEYLGRSPFPVYFLVWPVFLTPFESILILFRTATALQPHEVVVVADMASVFQVESVSE